MLLDIRDQNVEVLLESVDLFIELLGHLIFLSFVKDVLFEVLIDLLYIYNQLIRFFLNGLNFLQNVLNLNFLRLLILNDVVNTFEVLVSVNVFRHLFPLAFEVDDHVFLLLKILDGLLDFFLKVFDLVDFILVFNSFVCDSLLFVLEFFCDRLFILIPLFFELIELGFDSTNLSLKDLKILSLKLCNFLNDFITLSDSLLLRFELISHLLSFLFNDFLLLRISFVSCISLFNLLLQSIQLANIA